VQASSMSIPEHLSSARPVPRQARPRTILDGREQRS
jgi:hypothetical protein